MPKFKSFAAAGALISSIGKNLESNANNMTGRFCNQILFNVCTTTPVDTGQARGNWRMQTDSPDKNQYIGKSYYDPIGIATYNKGASNINGKDLSSVYITNNLPYIVPLNFGSSKQAPPHFIESCVNSAVKSINTKVLWS